MKNCSHSISDILISGCSPHSGNSQRFKLNAESPSMPEKDIELLYCLIGRLLLTIKVTISDVQACVTYILTRTELSTNYHNDRHLNIDILFVKKIQIFVFPSAEDQCTHFETLISKHKNYILIILQQIIQSQRLKNVFTVLEGAFKNMSKWRQSSLHTDKIKYITDPQVHTTNNARRATHELMNQGVKIEGIQ